MKDKIKQLAEIYIMVETGQMSPRDMFLAFRSRFPEEVKNARNRWREKHTGWESLDWSKIENYLLLYVWLLGYTMADMAR